MNREFSAGRPGKQRKRSRSAHSLARTAGCAFLLLALASFSTARPSGSGSRRPFTIADSIEATYVLRSPEGDPAILSPDGRKYAVVLYRGDVARNGIWVEFLVGSTASLRAACEPERVARFFSRSTARVSEMIENIRWLGDDEHLVFLWDDGEAPARVVSVDVRTHQVRTLARHATPIVKYDVAPSGRTVVFMAGAMRDKSKEEALERAGFSVLNQSIWALLQNNPDGWTPREHFETFVWSAGQVRKIHEAPSPWATSPELLKLSPDGRFALSVEPARSVPAVWDGYIEHIFKDDYLPAARRNPSGPNMIRQYFVIDTEHATARPLWNAPEYPIGRVVWSPDSREVAVGPTFLPIPSAAESGLAAQAAAVIDVVSGNFEFLPLPAADLELQYRPVLWTRDGVIQLVPAAEENKDAARLSFKKVDGNWVLISHPERPNPLQAVHVELREGPNSPPALYAVKNVDETQRLVKDLDPGLKADVTLGRVDLVHWRATDGRPWSGMLYYPVDFDVKRRFPFVIQTHGYSAERFSPDGSFTTVFAAQALANRDIAVLQVGGPDGAEDDFTATPQEPEVFMAGVQGAINHFLEEGLADPKRVGIIGFSRTGWLVEYLLTHSNFPFAAAEVADNIDVSYVQYVLGAGALKAEYEADTGSRPFGTGLDAWLRNAPGFNCDRLYTPLRLEVDSGPIEAILGQWEMFSNLRALGRPVELFVIPDISHGAHILTSPAQRLASQGGTVDWFSFWLKGEEDPAPAKRAEYARWRELARLFR